MTAKNMTIITCESILPEIEKIAPEELEVKVLEFGLHNHPPKLNEKLKESLAEIEDDGNCDTVLFGYGLCSDGVVGLKAEDVKLVIPKTDDCIALFLGSRDKYTEELYREPGTFYLTKGWIEHGETPLAIYNQETEWTKKYTPEKIHWLAREVIKNYSRIALIDTGAYDLTKYIDYAKETADIFELDYELVPGSLGLLEKLIFGNWDDNFVVVEPGIEVTRELFQL